MLLKASLIIVLVEVVCTLLIIPLESFPSVYQVCKFTDVLLTFQERTFYCSFHTQWDHYSLLSYSRHVCTLLSVTGHLPQNWLTDHLPANHILHHFKVNRFQRLLLRHWSIFTKAFHVCNQPVRSVSSACFHNFIVSTIRQAYINKFLSWLW